MNLAEYFSPLSPENMTAATAGGRESLGGLIDAHLAAFPDWEHADIILLGVPEERGNPGRAGSAEAPTVIRQYLYQLAAPLTTMAMADLGDLRTGQALPDTCAALAEVTAALVRAGKTLLLLGGTQDVSLGLYQGLEALEVPVEYVSIDSSPDILAPDEAAPNHSFHHQLLTHTPNYLSNFTLLGSQAHFLTEGERKALKAMNFPSVPIGRLNQDIREAEPHLREAHAVSFDLSAIRHSDAPGTSHPSPAGFNVDQACQLARYAGMGYNAQAMALCEVNPAADIRNVTSHTAALIAWYFLEGFYNRLNDRPKADRSNLRKHLVQLSGPIGEIVFYKSEHSSRWWMEVPIQAAPKTPARRVLVPCSEQDYEQAATDDIPERWWLTYYRHD